MAAEKWIVKGANDYFVGHSRNGGTWSNRQKDAQRFATKKCAALAAGRTWIKPENVRILRLVPRKVAPPPPSPPWFAAISVTHDGFSIATAAGWTAKALGWAGEQPGADGKHPSGWGIVVFGADGSRGVWPKDATGRPVISQTAPTAGQVVDALRAAMGASK